MAKEASFIFKKLRVMGITYYSFSPINISKHAKWVPVLLLIWVFVCLCACGKSDAEKEQGIQVQAYSMLPAWVDSLSMSDFVTHGNAAKYLEKINELEKDTVFLANLNDYSLLQLMKGKIKVFSLVEGVEKVFEILNQAIPLALSQGDTSFLIKTIGNYNIVRDYDYATQLEKKWIDLGLAASSNREMDAEKAGFFQIKGHFLIKEQRFEEAIDYFNKANNYYFISKDSLGQFLTSVAVGNIFFHMGSLKEAKNYYRNALSFAKASGNTRGTMSAYNNLGSIFFEEKLLDSAIICYEFVLDLAVQTSQNVLSSKYNLANTYLLKNDFRRALTAFQSVYKDSKESGLLLGQALSMMGMGLTYLGLGEKKIAIQNLEASLDLVNEGGLHQYKSAMIEKLEIAYEDMGNYVKAYQYFNERSAINDSLLSLDKQSLIHQMGVQHSVLLDSIENAHLTIQIQEKEEILKKRNLLLFATLIVLGFLTYLYHTKVRLTRGLDYAYNALMKLYKEMSLEPNQFTNNRIFENDESGVLEQSIMEKLENYFRSQSPFLNSNLMIGDVAEALKIESKSISQALKFYEIPNFSFFVNKFRVTKMIELMKEHKDSNITLDELSTAAGFGSRQSLYNAFKTHVGVQPGYFRDHFH